MPIKPNFSFKSAAAQAFLKKLNKNVEQVQTLRSKDYLVALSAIIFREVQDHFDKEQGEKNRWPEWSEAYTKHMKKKGKGANFILRDTGRLRNNFKPTKYTKRKGEITWYNDAKTKSGFPYAWAHNEGAKNEHGNKLPKRDFMWVGSKALDDIAETTLAFTLRGL